MDGVVVTGMGLVSPSLPPRREALREQLLAGCGRPPAPEAASPSALFDDIPSHHPDARKLDRLASFAVAAALRALRDAGLTLDEVESAGAGVLLGTGLGSLVPDFEYYAGFLQHGPSLVSPLLFPYTTPSAASAEVAIFLRARGPHATLSDGRVSALIALGAAERSIAHGRSELVLAGGLEVSGPAVARALGRLAYPPISEGACLLVLENRSRAARRGARPLGRILALADAWGGRRGRRALAHTLAEAIRLALAEANLQPREVDVLFPSFSAAEESETQGIACALGPRACHLPQILSGSLTGELFGAGGAFQSAAALVFLSEGRLPGTDARPRVALVTSLCPSGRAAALLLGTA